MRLPHVTPFASAPIYFLTACVAERRPVLANKAALDCLTGIWRKSALLDGWFVGRFVLMPDHVHVFASPAVEAKDRHTWLKVWKSVSARHLMKELGVAAPFWQSDTFDHILRCAESYTQKWDYVRNNPVRAGHVIRPEDWQWQGEIHSLAL